MLQSQRLATIPIPDLKPELAIIDAEQTSGEYDAFTFGSWLSHVLANGSGSAADTAFRPHAEALRPTELGERLPTVMSLVHNHFNTEQMQWIRIFSLQDGILAPHVDFLEFDEPGVRLQVPLRTTTAALHSENDIVYHLRQGEVWQIHTTDPHSACSGPGPARLSLCLDFAGGDLAPEEIIRDSRKAEQDIHIKDRPPLSDAEVDGLLELGSTMTAENMREKFRAFAAVHFRRAAHVTDAFDWFARAAELGSEPGLAEKAIAFRAYCIEKRAYREIFDW